VVTTQDEEVLGVLDLVGKEQADGLQGLLATVDVITEEEVVGLRGESTVFEQTQKVVVLAVNITTDLTKKTEKS
jgi:cell division protein ZapA (FtsZ GTPase activity inhibitor)